jgi:hypothetical protein
LPHAWAADLSMLLDAECMIDVLSRLRLRT